MLFVARSSLQLAAADKKLHDAEAAAIAAQFEAAGAEEQAAATRLQNLQRGRRAKKDVAAVRAKRKEAEKERAEADAAAKAAKRADDVAKGLITAELDADAAALQAQMGSLDSQSAEVRAAMKIQGAIRRKLARKKVHIRRQKLEANREKEQQVRSHLSMLKAKMGALTRIVEELDKGKPLSAKWKDVPAPRMEEKKRDA